MYKNENQSILISLYKFKDQVDQGSPDEPASLKLMEKKVSNSLKHMGIGGLILNRTQIVYALRSRIDKCDP